MAFRGVGKLRTMMAAAALASVVPATAPLMAQASQHTQIISISPLSLVFGLIGAEYERKMSSTTAWGASGSFYKNSGYSYTSAEGKYRYYPEGKALQGFSVSGTGGLTRVGADADVFEGSESASSTALTVGAALDYQWLTGAKKNFAITLGLGARRLIFLGDGIDGANLTLPTARISIGRAF